MRIVIAGGSGFLGQVLRRHFHDAGHTVVTLSRRPERDRGQVVPWDGRTPGPWCGELPGTNVLINLSGKSVDCRYTPANKQAIYDSRLHSTRVLGEALAACDHPPPLWINASSGTIYRHAEDRDMDEATGELGEGFSVDVCQQWERTFFEAPGPGSAFQQAPGGAAHTDASSTSGNVGACPPQAPTDAEMGSTPVRSHARCPEPPAPDGIRRVALRTAIVLGRNGGAFTPLRTLARLGLGGKMGNGRQFMSWLHEDDFAGIVNHIIAHDDLAGPINAAAPHPVPNTEFMRVLRHARGMPIGLPMPAWLLEFGAVLIRTETELVLKSRRVAPARLLESGYGFRFPDLAPALADLVR